MKTFFTQCIVVICCATMTMTSLQAQQNSDGDIVQQSLADMYTVAGLGAAGAILGLSTLSFVEEPGDNLNNIVVGAAIGVIVGVGVVAWSQAEKSRETFSAPATSHFPTYHRRDWHKTSHASYTQSIASIKSAAMNFTF